MRRLILIVIAMSLTAPTSGNASDQDAGAALFLQGEGASALLAGGQVRVDGADFACAKCHGGDALGRGEGGTEFPPITWATLSNPSRSEGAYDETGFMLAIREGIATNGRVLSNAMPRYEVDSATLSALAVFLARIDALERSGVSATDISIGFPVDPVRYELFDLALSEANAIGGVWGRRFTSTLKGKVFTDWNEIAGLLSDALVRAEETAVTNFLQSQLIDTVTLDSDGGRWQSALSRAGVSLSDDAPVRLTVGESGPVINMTNVPGTTSFRFRLPAIAGSSGNSMPDLTQGMRSAYAIGTTIANVILDCGRAVTRACVLERLDNADLSDWVETVQTKG